MRQALASPVPPAKRAPSGRPAPKLGAYRALVDAWLEADREAPRKQRHTARRPRQGARSTRAVGPTGSPRVVDGGLTEVAPGTVAVLVLAPGVAIPG